MLSLPFDIIHTLFDFATVEDLVNFCSTCKALHRHLAVDSLWKRACAPYGLRDFRHFGGISPFIIFTELIRPYGPILGLWANDHPFRGNVMEFKVFAGNENEQGGIIGEVWSFPTRADRDPDPPSYIRATKISFESEVTEPEDTGPPGDTPQADTRTEVRIFCYSDPSTPSTRHHADLYVRAPTNTRHRLEFYRHTLDLPEMSLYDLPWYDPTSRLPLLPEEPDGELDQSTLIKIYPAARLPLIWAGPSDTHKPPAMSIRCSQDRLERCPSAALHAPSIPFKSLDDRPPRYYPLRRTILPSVDPHSPEWSLQCLEGLWYGSYGHHGTELLYLFVEDQRGQLVAMKVTGDAHVPRGPASWVVSVPEEGSVDANITRDRWAMALQARYESVVASAAVSSPARILRGAAILAPERFGR